MNEDYAKAYKEVLEILKYMPIESVRKIPQKLLKALEKNQDNSYYYKIDETKSLKDQVILKETKAILANLYRDYWATESQRKEILQDENRERIGMESKKREQYNPENLFKGRLEESIKDQKQNSQTLPIMLETNHFWNRINNWIKHIFHKRFSKK